MTLQEAVACALANEPEDARRPGPRRTLTNRETEVAVLAARGLTNRDIAARLCLSVRTVEVHVDHILTSWASAPARSWRPGPTRRACGQKISSSR